MLDRNLRRRALLGVLLVATPAEAAPDEGPSSEAPRTPVVTLEHETGVELSFRSGMSLNRDQWMLGGALPMALGFMPGLEVTPALTFGVGGNHLTMKAGGALAYRFWIGGPEGVGLGPALGLSALFSIPVGSFASFCRRVDLRGCADIDVGVEVGAEVRFRWLLASAMAGFEGLPKLTLLLGVEWDLGG